MQYGIDKNNQSNKGENKMKTRKSLKVDEMYHERINRIPEETDCCGSYKVVDENGIYWGTYYVGKNWCGEKFVASADSRDGLPW
jgi:hypothetical protein